MKRILIFYLIYKLTVRYIKTELEYLKLEPWFKNLRMLWKIANFMMLFAMYLIGLFLIVVAIGLVVYAGFFYGYPLLLAGVLLLPPAWRLLTVTNGKPFPRWVQILTVMAVMMYWTVMQDWLK